MACCKKLSEDGAVVDTDALLACAALLSKTTLETVR